jgi:hypothetical protein
MDQGLLESEAKCNLRATPSTPQGQESADRVVSIHAVRWLQGGGPR